MKTRTTSAVVLAVCVSMLVVALGLYGPTTAQAVNMYYVDGERNDVDPVDPDYPVNDLDDFWNNPFNWSTSMTGGEGTYRLPVDGDFLVFGTNGLEYGNTDIDIAGATIYLPNSGSNCNRNQYRFIDSVGGGSIELGVFETNYAGPHSVSVPLIAGLVKTGYRASNTTFYSTINAGQLQFGDGNVRLHDDVTVSESALFLSDPGVIVYLQPEAGEPTPTLDTPVLNVTGGNTYANMSGFVVSPEINIYDGGRYYAKIDGSVGDATTIVTLSDGGALYLDIEQTTSFPTILANAGGALFGNMTGAEYSGAGQNVTFTENAIFGVTAGPSPTRADLGGSAILFEAITNANNAASTFTYNADAGIYKGWAMGAWTTSDQIKATFESQNAPMSGMMLRNMKNQAEAVYKGDGTSTVANIAMGPNGVLQLDADLNQNAIAAATTNLMKTFNFTRTPGRERTDILRFGAGGIDATQIINVDGGRVDNMTALTGGGLRGALNITNAEVERPTDDFTAADTGSLHLGDRAVLDLTDPSNIDYLEALGTRLTYSGNPVALLQGDTNATYTFDPAVTPVLAGFLANADYVATSYKDVYVTNDLVLGDGKYLMATYWRQNGKGISAAAGFTPKIVYAGNGSLDGTDTIGIAANGSNTQINMEVYAPAATLVLGSNDPNRIFHCDSGTDSTSDERSFLNHIATGTVTVEQNVTALGINVESGSANINSGVALLSSGPAVPFVINMDSVTGGSLLSIGGIVDDANPLQINATAGQVHFSTGTAIDLSNTSVVAGGSSTLKIGNNNAIVTLANLELNTDAFYGSNNGSAHLKVAGTLSGSGKFVNGSSNNTATILTGGTLAPGSDVGLLDGGGTSLVLEDAVTYDWEFSDLHGVAGDGWDIYSTNAKITVAGDLTFNISEVGLKTPIFVDQEFVVLSTSNSNNLILTAWNPTINVGPGDINGDAATLTKVGSTIVLTGLVREGTIKTWDNGDGDGLWSTGLNWDIDGTPDTMSISTVGGAVAVTSAAPNTFQADVIAGGSITVNNGGSLTLVDKIDLADGAALTVNAGGSFEALTINNAGAMTIGGSAGIANVNVTGATAQLDVGGQLDTYILNSSGIVNVTGTGTVNANSFTNTGPMTDVSGAVNATTNFTSGATDISGTVTTGAFSASGATNISGTVIAGGAFSASGATDISGTVTAGGAFSTSDTTVISGAVNSNTFTTSGTTTITGDVESTGSFASSGTTNIQAASLVSAASLDISGGVTTINTGATFSAPTIKVTGGQLDLPISVDNLTVSGTGDVTIAEPGLIVSNANFIAGTVDATIPLAISSELKLPGNITATYTPGDGATSFTASGANLADLGVASTMTLSGGTLNLPGASTYDIGLQGSLFRNAPRNDTFLNLEGSTYVADPTRIFTGDKANTVLSLTSEPGYDIVVNGEIACANNNEWGPFPTLDGDWENFVTAYSGRFFPSESGTYDFRSNCDDAAWMWIDMDDNGVFDAGENVGNHDWTVGDGGDGGDGTKVLDNTRGYNVVIMGQEYGGGRTVNWTVTKPSGGADPIDTTDAAGNGGQWMYGAGGTGATNMPNTTVVATANSTLTTDGATITLGGIETSNATTLTINGDATAIQLTNMTLGGGSQVMSSYATDTTDPADQATFTVTGTLTGGESVSELGDFDDIGKVGLTMGADSTYDMTFTGTDSYIDVTGSITLTAGMTIDIDGSVTGTAQDIKLLYTYSDFYDIAGVTTIGADLSGLTIGVTPLINLITPAEWTHSGLGWLLDQGAELDENYLVLLGVSSGGVVAPQDGDANGDYTVNEADMALLLAQFGSAYDLSLTADFTGDGFVDLADFVILRANWGLTSEAPTASDLPNVTPEPATMTMLALGGLLALRRRRRKA